MKRKIIEIDEALCNGCGNCIIGCAEGALQLVDGKAKLVKDQFCDGLGACIGTCPTGALKIIEREADAFDEAAVQDHLSENGPKESPAGGCPGMQIRFGGKPDSSAEVAGDSVAAGQVIRSDLNQWPIQLHLVPPEAPFFKERELAVLSTCSPVASPDVHWRYVRGRSVVTACPKLDRTDGYAEKLAAILARNAIPKVIVVRMEVPCCGGLTQLVRAACAASGRTDLEMEEVTIGIGGELIKTERIM